MRRWAIVLGGLLAVVAVTFGYVGSHRTADAACTADPPGPALPEHDSRALERQLNGWDCVLGKGSVEVARVHLGWWPNDPATGWSQFDPAPADNTNGEDPDVPTPADCPDFAPGVLPSGAEPGQPTDFETDYGQGLAWGDGDDQVVLVNNEAAWAAAGDQAEFQSSLQDGHFESVSGPDGTRRAVVPIGEVEGATVQILFADDGCDYLLFTTLPVEQAAEYATEF